MFYKREKGTINPSVQQDNPPVTHQRCLDAHALGGRERVREVLALVVPQTVVGHAVRQVRVEEGAEGQAIVPRRTKVRDVHVPVADQLVLAPLQQGIPLRASIHHERVQRVLSLT